MAHWVSVIGFSNGEYVNDTTFNRPIMALRERTDYLYKRLNDLSGDASFESLRITNAALTLGTDVEPEVKDFVYLNPVTKTYEKAVASVTTAGNIFQTANSQAYSLGILVSKSAGVGTIALYGRVRMGDTSDWDLSTMLEAGETFQAGPYYLSPSEPGKMSSNPRNVAIYLGYFTDSDTPGVGGHAMLSPQYKDVGEAHMHRAFPIAGRVAGTQEVIGTPPINATHKVHGYEPKSEDVAAHGIATAAGSALVDGTADFTLDGYVGLMLTNVTATADPARAEGLGSLATVNSSRITGNDVTNISTVDTMDWRLGDEYHIGSRSRLIVVGQYSGATPTTYTLTLVNSSDSVGIGGGPINGTLGFDDVFLDWASSDPTEGHGAVRITSYEVPVPFGTKGLSAILENVLEDFAGDQQWNFAEACSESLNRRQFVLDVPEQTKGWRQRRFRQNLSQVVAEDGKFSMVLFTGATFDNVNKQLATDVRVGLFHLYQINYAIPADGDTVRIGTVTYEFDSDGSVTPDNIPVSIDAYSAQVTFDALRSAVLANGDTAVTVAMDTTYARFMIGVRPTDTVALTGTISSWLEELCTGDDVDLDGPAYPNLLVYDDAYNSLISTASVSYWKTIEYYKPVTLVNNLRLMVVPFSIDRVPAESGVMTYGDNWFTTVTDEAPGAKFEYSLDMEASVRRYYPPVPLSAAALVVNGVEMESGTVHPDNAVYLPAFHGIYWMYDNYSRIPWPVDWVNYTNQGEFAVLATLYLAQMRLTTTSVVTSLQAAPGSPIKVLRCGTSDPATTGDLALDLDLVLTSENSNLPDYQVFKQVQGSKLLKGPVVSKIVPGSGISISNSPGVPAGAGEVTISLAAQQSYSGDMTDIALDNAKQELIGMFPYIRLLDWVTGSPSNVPTGFVAKFVVPQDIVGTYQVAIYITVFGETDILLTPDTTSRLMAGLKFSYSVLHDYEPTDDLYGTLLDNLIEPVSARSVEVPLGRVEGTPYGDPPVNYLYKAYDPMIIHNNPNDINDEPARIRKCLGGLFPAIGDKQGGVVQTDLAEVTVQGGNLVGIRIQRAGVSNPNLEYTGKLGFARIRWQLIRIS